MKTISLSIILSVVSVAYARAGEPENVPATVKPPAPLNIVHAPQLNVDYPVVKLADGRVLSEARVTSFDKKNLTFCIGHRQGIEVAVPWGAMPTAWQVAFPLSADDAQRGADQVAAAHSPKKDLNSATASAETAPLQTVAQREAEVRLRNQRAADAAHDAESKSNAAAEAKQEADRLELLRARSAPVSRLRRVGGG